MRAPRWWTVLAVVAVLAGIALRVWMLTGHLFTLDADEAIVGSMADHFRHGELRAFYWGQEYGGSGEPLLTAVLFRAFGPSVLALKLVPAVLSAVACVLLWRAGRRLVGDTAAQAAALLFWVAPGVFVWWATKARGFYWLTLVAGLVVVLAACWIADRRRPLVAWATLGLAAGFGWWCSPAILYFLAPTGVWLLSRHWRTFTHAWVAVVPTLVGASPWLWHNLHHEWGSLERPPQPETVSYLGGIGRLLWRVLPMTMNLQRPFSQATMFPAAFPWLYVAVLGAVAVALALRPDRPLLLVLLLVALPFVYALFPGAWFIGEARYAFYAAPLLALAVMWMLGTRWMQGATIVVAAILSVLALRPLHMPSPTHVDDDITALEAAGIDHLWLDYWLATRITFESEERVLAASTFYVRYPPHHDAVRDDPAAAYAYLRGDRKLTALEAVLRARGISYRLVSTPHLVVVVPEHSVAPDDLPNAARP